MKIEKALIPGSFDPITLGHMDIVERAAGLFDTVYLLLCTNSEKKDMFTREQRLELMKTACTGLDNVIVDVCDGLLADYAALHDIAVIVKGARTGADFDYEKMLYNINARLGDGLETILLPARAELSYISSTYVRELVKYKKPLYGAVPAGIVEMIYNSHY